jgi:FKBP-type peptidyl-prolyl cis-trans isomerase FkpA
MRSMYAPLVALLLLAPAAVASQDAASLPPPAAQPPAAQPGAADKDTLYAIGVNLSRNAKALHLSQGEAEIVARGFADALSGQKLRLDPAKYEQKIQALVSARITAATKKNKEAGQAFVATAAREPGAKKTESGVVYRVLKEGTGANPKPTDTVNVNILGKLIDGTVFEERTGGKTELGLSRVHRCISEGVAKMKVGGKARLVCPPETAFGDRGSPPLVPPASTVVFEVELVAARAASASDKPAGHPQMGSSPPGHP